MSDIRYVCLSDMHLGEEDSLLTNLQAGTSKTDPKEPSPVLATLVECLEDLISRNKGNAKPTLVLCGDILDLALCDTNEAAMFFQKFIELIMRKDRQLFDEIVYIPGNHDHHLWESARETQYVDYVTKNLAPDDELPFPWHTTYMFIEKKTDRVPSYFLSRLIQRHPHLKDFNITVVYPNFGVFNKENRRCVVFSHGHYIESLYSLMSDLKSLIFKYHKSPELIWKLEEENFAWIDFFWSTLGRSGEVGRDVELIYEKMHDEKQFEKLIDNLAKNLAEKYDLPGPSFLEDDFAGWAMKKAVGKFSKRERTQTGANLSKEAKAGLEKYVNGPLKNQILDRFDTEADIPSDLTFVFGHTHKPFEEVKKFAGFRSKVKVINTGGWVVESVKPQRRHGASVVLVDHDLNSTAVRIYNESGRRKDYTVKAQEAIKADKAPSPFCTEVEQSIGSSSELWSRLSSVISDSVNIRRKNFVKRIQRNI